MLPWQEEYISNAREIIRLRDYAGCGSAADYPSARARADDLIRRNNVLLNLCFFPVLDDLPAAAPETLQELDAFGNALLDWKTNLDIGVYIALHEALLRLHRVRRDRNSVIRELYKLGMGLYYQRRMVLGAESGLNHSFDFENELVFSEAASYIRYFAEIDDEETRGYVIRSLANIALCTHDSRRKIAIGTRVLRILRDPEIRAMAPGLPWERFLRSTHQQMSANRVSLSRGDLTQEELSTVLDSCYEVFKPEEAAENPSLRWLWPYYEMEYSCGYVNLEMTLKRLGKLITQARWDQYDTSGLYGNIQLACNYGQLLDRHPALQEDPKQIAFLEQAYRKMEKNLMTAPLGCFDDYFHFSLVLPFFNYAELPGTTPYRDVIIHLIMRFFGDDYILGRTRGDAMALCCDALLRRNPDCFEDLPLPLRPGESRREAVLALARDGGLLMDLGRICMNTIRRPRDLFESEYKMTLLHPAVGRDALRRRGSTRLLADIAFGHHSWYNGSADGYPSDYIRTASPMRQMTDVAALVTYLTDNRTGSLDGLLKQVFALEGRQFSPMVTAVLDDPALQSSLADLLAGKSRPLYDQEIRAELSRWPVSPAV